MGRVSELGMSWTAAPAAGLARRVGEEGDVSTWREARREVASEEEYLAGGREGHEGGAKGRDRRGRSCDGRVGGGGESAGGSGEGGRGVFVC